MLSVIASDERKRDSVCAEDGDKKKGKVKVQFTL
jgi:hypothetical protein